MSSPTDCLIVGGGVIGLSIAYELAGRGQQVTLIDRQEPGQEASWAGAGILPPSSQESTTDAWPWLAGYSCHLHSDWSRRLREETGIDNGYTRCGGIYLARTDGDAQLLEQQMGELFDSGVEVQRLMPGVDLGNLESELRPLESLDVVRAAFHLPGEAQIRNPRHLKALYAAALHRGVDVQPGVTAYDFETDGDRVTALATSDGRMSAASVCVAAGAWSAALLERAGMRTALKPIRGQMVLLACRRRKLKSILNEGPRYIVPRDDGRVLIGSTEEDVGFCPRTTAFGVAELIKLGIDLVPGFCSSQVERTWAGLRPSTVDGMPYLGRSPRYENLLVATGHFRAGLLTSPGTAVVMSDLVCGQSPPVDLSPLSPGRHG